MRVFFISDVAAQRAYFTRDIVPLKAEFQKFESSQAEFQQARNFVISNSVEFYLDKLESTFSADNPDKIFLEIDAFLAAEGVKHHVSGCLAIVFEKFLAEFNESVERPDCDVMELFRRHVLSLQSALNEWRNYETELHQYFLTYLKGPFLENLTFRYNNNIQTYLEVTKRVYAFLAVGKRDFAQLAKSFEKVERSAFLKIKDFLLDYFDKFEGVLAIDRHYDYLSAVFKVFETKALKLWVVDVVDSYVDSTHNKEVDLFNKYSLVFRLERASFKSIEKFMKVYLKKKNEGFVKDQIDKALHLDVLRLDDKTALDKADQGKLVAFYKDLFKRLFEHLTKTAVANVRACVIKDYDFKMHFYDLCVKAFVAVYHRELSEFLAMELQGVDKKSVFVYYANEVEEQLKEDLFGY